jgi:hypothetical protein
MTAVDILALIFTVQAAPDSGYLNVRSNMPGIVVYLDGDYLGRTPVENVRLAPDQYLVSIVSNDSLENVYWKLREAPLGQKVSAVWTLAAINTGSQPVRVEAGRVSEVYIDYGRVANARSEAKFATFGVTGGLFLLGAIVGLVIGALAF